MASVPSSEETQTFHDELRWCITQLELGLQRQDPNSRQALETMKILKILRSPKAPLVKKRQAMRNALGDYRKKMKESEKKFLSGLRNSRFQTTGNAKAHSKSKYLRQSHSKTVDRDVLGSHLSNLHLQRNCVKESPNLGSASGSCVQAESSSLAFSSPGIASFDNISTATDVEGRSFLTATCSVLLSSTASKSESSCSPTEDDFGRTPDSEVPCRPTVASARNTFHFVPSDNSFCFGFSNESDSKISDQALDERGEPGKILRGNNNCPNSKLENGNQISDDIKVKPNVFKYERTDNSFVFNFS